MAVDCHIHMALDGGYWKDALARHKDAPDEAFIRRTLETYKTLGFTYLRDGGDRWNAGKRASELAGEYGMTYRTPCFPIYRKGHYGSFIGRGFETIEEFRALVLEVKQHGGHFIKIMISGLMDFNHYGVLTDEPMPENLIAELTKISHDEGFSVMAHANGDAAVRGAVKAGIDSVEHGAYLTDETLHMLSESKTVWVPTLVTIGNLIGDARFPESATKPLPSRCRNRHLLTPVRHLHHLRSWLPCGPLPAKHGRAGASASRAGRLRGRNSCPRHGRNRIALLSGCVRAEGLIQ